VIVCVCRAVCDRRLAAIVDQGAETVEEVERVCGAGGDCGTCRPEIEALIELRIGGAERTNRAA